MTLQLSFPDPMTVLQVRRLQILWRRWVRNLSLTHAQDRRLRHYYVALFSAGRAPETRLLERVDAAKVISWLERLTDVTPSKQKLAAGTAGREGFPERRRIPPNAAAWGALLACTRALGWDRAVLEHFIREHYGSVGLQGLNDLHTMADLNRVLWGLKAILRRRPGSRQQEFGKEAA